MRVSISGVPKERTYVTGNKACFFIAGIDEKSLLQGSSIVWFGGNFKYFPHTPQKKAGARLFLRLLFLFLQGRALPYSYFLRREESSKEASTLSKASPYMGRMQPLLLSLLHFGKLGPSKVPLIFIDYARRWSIRRWSIWLR